MSASLSSTLDRWLGLHVAAADLTFAQMAGRTLIVFLVGLILVRVADRRFLGRNAGFDVLLGIVLGSVLSRAINGQASFFPTLGVAALLVILHRLVSMLAARSDWFSKLLKGNARVLVRAGRAEAEELRRCNFSRDDLEENLRLHGNLAHTTEVGEARLERNGEVSVVPRDTKK
ncbi:MAG: putative rane protein [Lacunisphaera sp.]|nr:putative rane protein [Lacunisphaera sp.]